jgi:enoyl-CoA hydratase/carnithine racemase
MTRNQVRILLDAMIPGQSNRWPAAADVIDMDRVAESIASRLGDHAATLPLDGDDAPEWLARLAAASPAMMRAVTEVVYSAYYASAPVQAAIRDLAESGPRDPSPHFEETLLAQVRARAAQQRRP